MKKLLSVLVAALVATCAFAAVAIADKPKSVDSEVTIKFTPGTIGPYNPYGEEGRFHGKVLAKKGCSAKRKVLVKRVGGGTVGGTFSDAKGRWVVDLKNVGGTLQPGEYFATVKKRVVKVGKGKNHRHFKCEKAQSAAITAP